MRHEGVLCVVSNLAGQLNIITLGWSQIGPFYHGNPVLTIAVTPQRYSWRFLEEVNEFVIAVPDESMAQAAKICGTLSGRDIDKFQFCALTAVPSQRVEPPSILECPVNIECRIYSKVAPPHLLLTPEHRLEPIDHQHTIYFAEVLGTFGWEEDRQL